MPSEDFTGRKYFPGTTGNVFDVLLHRLVELEHVPAAIYALLLLLIAALPHFGSLIFTLALFSFFLVDWVLVANLPKAGISYGPIHPPVLLLSIFRALVAILPGWWSLPLQLLGTLLVIYGFWIEPQRLTLTHQHLTSLGFQPSRPLRLLHIGDLHIERITSRERRLNHLIREAKPDLILFSGDFLNLSYLRDPVAWEAARQVLIEWVAPMGVYAVSGSPAVDLEEILPPLLDRLPLTWLRDQRVDLQFEGRCIHLIGLNCSHKPFIDHANLERLVSDRQNGLTILLYHSPDLAPRAAQHGISLQLSGHTHGGQVRLPFIGALYAGSLYGKKYESGRYAIKDMILYVTRGIGMEGASAPRVRFLCPPEAILWEIG